jgi:hypothetical protein
MKEYYADFLTISILRSLSFLTHPKILILKGSCATDEYLD